MTIMDNLFGNKKKLIPVSYTHLIITPATNTIRANKLVLITLMIFGKVLYLSLIHIFGFIIWQLIWMQLMKRLKKVLHFM